MNQKNRENGENALICVAENGTLPKKLKKYLKDCRPPSDADPKKTIGKLPNLAGFCSALGCGVSAVQELKTLYPRHYDYLCAVMEDEALNSARSPALLNSYLKERLGYGEKNESEGDPSLLQPIFEHDILEDGK